MSERKDPEGYTTKVTHLGGGKYGCRILRDGKVIDQTVAESKDKIAPTLREMLRWQDKLYGDSSMASASRDRQKQKPV
jgi:hypothetical protein